MSNVDPLGLSADRGTAAEKDSWYDYIGKIMGIAGDIKPIYEDYKLYDDYGYHIYREGTRAYVIGGKKASKPTTFRKSYYDIPKISNASNVDDYWDVLKNVDVPTGLKSEFSLLKPSGKINGGAVLNYIGIAINVGVGIVENCNSGTDTQRIITDAAVDASVGVGVIAASTAIGSAIGSVVPVAGNIVGAGVGFLVGTALDWFINAPIFDEKSALDWVKDSVDAVADDVFSTE